jgi:hypothetical protein
LANTSINEQLTLLIEAVDSLTDAVNIKKQELDNTYSDVNTIYEDIKNYQSNSIIISSSDEFIVTGPTGNGFSSIESAIEEINSNNVTRDFAHPVKITIKTRSLEINSPITVPQYVSIIGKNTRISSTMESGNIFNLSGYNNIYGLEYIGGNANNTNYIYNCGDNTDIGIIECHLYGGSTNKMRFMSASGNNFARLNAERCLINYYGSNNYAFDFNNTGNSTRFCDMWFDSIFSDSYFLSNYGGNFNFTNCSDARILRSTIRGANAVYTGLRVSGSSKLQCFNTYFDNAIDLSQNGFDIYVDTTATFEYGSVTAKRVGFPTGSTIIYKNNDLSTVDVL